jgi:hypothetical protein
MERLKGWAMIAYKPKMFLSYLVTSKCSELRPMNIMMSLRELSIPEVYTSEKGIAISGRPNFL